MGLTVGVDVGGTKIAAGVVDEKGEILERRRLDSPATNSEAIESTIAELVLDLKRDHDVEAVGVGAAGFVDVRRSTVLFAPNLAWRDEPLKASSSVSPTCPSSSRTTRTPRPGASSRSAAARTSTTCCSSPSAPA